MGIQNFPAALQPIIQQGYLEASFEEALVSKLAYRSIADRVSIPNRVGETVTKTRAGLKPTVKASLAPSANTNLDNGLASSTFAVEQYTLTMAMFADTIDLNMVTERVGIASQFVQNAYVNGEQARRTLDEQARNALFAPYFGGNTRVLTTLSSAGTTLKVDDIRGFQAVPSLNGFSSATAAIAAGVQPTWQPVSATNPLNVSVGANPYVLVSAVADASNGSSAPSGISGTLTFASAVTVADGTAGNAVVAANASTIVRPNGRSTPAALQATDTLTMAAVLNAVAVLRSNNVPTAEGGVYNCYLDPVSSRQLFSDNDFRQLFQGVGLQAPFLQGELVSPFLGARFIPTTQAYVQAHPTLAGINIRRPIVVGQGALIEGDFDGLAEADVAPRDSVISIVDGVAMVTREPLDRLQQIIAQSWYWIGGFCAPSDVTASTSTISTATNATYKRAVLIEHAG